MMIYQWQLTPDEWTIDICLFGLQVPQIIFFRPAAVLLAEMNQPWIGDW